MLKAAQSFDDAVAQYAMYLLTAGGRARTTVDSYSRDLEQFAELANLGRLDQLDRHSVLRWLNALYERGYSGRSLARKLSALRGFVAWALDYGHLAADPIPQDVSLPRGMYLPHALSEAAVAAIIDAVPQPPAGVLDAASLEAIRDRALLEMLYATGVRVSELCSLKLLDLQLSEAVVFVTGKGSQRRLVPVGHFAIETLSAYLAGPRAQLNAHAMAHGEVFLTQRGPISRSQVFRIVKRYAALAGIAADVSPHTLRHSCASHMLARGADLRLVQELLGHANLSTTQIYTHIELARLRQVYDECHPMA